MTSPESKDDLELELVREAAEADKLEAALRELDRRHPPESPYQSAEFLVPWLAYYSRRAGLSAVILREAGRPAAVLPLVRDVVKRGPLRARRLGLPAHGGHPPTLDIRTGERDAPAAARALLSLLSGRAGRCDVISLRHLSANSALLKLLPVICRKNGLTIAVYPARRESYVSLDGDWESYLSRVRGDHRRLIKRRMKQVDEDPHWEFVHQWPGEDEVEEVAARYVAVIARSWKSEEARDVAFVEFLKEMMRGFARRKDLLVSWLKGPGGDGASLLQLRQGGVLSGFHQAYAEDCPVKGPGTLLLGSAVKFAFESGLAIYDFATYAEHIHRWGPLFRNSFHVYITRKSPVGWIIQKNLARKELSKGEPQG